MLHDKLKYSRFNLNQLSTKNLHWIRSSSIGTNSNIKNLTSTAHISSLFSREFPYYLVQGSIDRKQNAFHSKLQLERIAKELYFYSATALNVKKSSVKQFFKAAGKGEHSSNCWEIYCFPNEHTYKFSLLNSFRKNLQFGGQLSVNAIKKSGTLNLAFLIKSDSNAHASIGAKMNPILGHLDLFNRVRIGDALEVGGWCFLNYYNLDSECIIGAKLQPKGTSFNLRVAINTNGKLFISTEEVPLLHTDDGTVSLSLGVNFQRGTFPSLSAAINC